MSKRYGRNQRRRHREEIAQLRAAHALNDALIRDQGRKLREARDTIREMVSVIEAVCPYSVALPPKKKRVYGSHYRMDTSSPLAKMVLGPNDSVGFEWVEARLVDLHALQMHLQENRERFQVAVHLRYEGNDGRAGYMISEKALSSIPEDVVLRNLLPDIGRELLRVIRSRR